MSPVKYRLPLHRGGPALGPFAATSVTFVKDLLLWRRAGLRSRMEACATVPFLIFEIVGIFGIDGLADQQSTRHGHLYGPARCG
jgi:hypothetical protein